MKKAVFVFAALIFLLAYLQSDGVAAEGDCPAPEPRPECVDVPHHSDLHEDGEKDKKTKDGHEIKDPGKSIIDKSIIDQTVRGAIEKGVRAR
jgi:hypothetical protein